MRILIDDDFEDESRISDPAKEVVWILCGWRCNYNTRLITKSEKRYSLVLRIVHTKAPDDLDPAEPIFASKPALAIGPSDAM